MGFAAWFIELAKRFGFEIMKKFEPQRRKGAEFMIAKRVAGGVCLSDRLNHQAIQRY